MVTPAMLDQARLVPALLQENTFTFLLRSGLNPWWMAKSGGAWRQSPWLPLTTRLGDILLTSLILATSGGWTREGWKV